MFSNDLTHKFELRMLSGPGLSCHTPGCRFFSAPENEMGRSSGLSKLPLKVPKLGTNAGTLARSHLERNCSNNGVARGTPSGNVQTTGEAMRRALRPLFDHVAPDTQYIVHGQLYVLMRCISDKSAYRQRRIGSLFMLPRGAFPGQGPPADQVLLGHVPLLLLAFHVSQSSTGAGGESRVRHGWVWVPKCKSLPPGLERAPPRLIPGGGRL